MTTYCGKCSRIAVVKHIDHATPKEFRDEQTRRKLDPTGCEPTEVRARLACGHPATFMSSARQVREWMTLHPVLTAAV